jgi:hypothetical protein
MTIKTRFAALALAALALTGSVACTTTPAEAHGLGWGVGAGLVGAAIVGGAIAASNPNPYYDGYHRCGNAHAPKRPREGCLKSPTPSKQCRTAVSISRRSTAHFCSNVASARPNTEPVLNSQLVVGDG